MTMDCMVRFDRLQSAFLDLFTHQVFVLVVKFLLKEKKDPNLPKTKEKEAEHLMDLE